MRRSITQAFRTMAVLTALICSIDSIAVAGQDDSEPRHRLAFRPADTAAALSLIENIVRSSLRSGDALQLSEVLAPVTRVNGVDLDRMSAAQALIRSHHEALAELSEARAFDFVRYHNTDIVICQCEDSYSERQGTKDNPITCEFLPKVESLDPTSDSLVVPASQIILHVSTPEGTGKLKWVHSATIAVGRLAGRSTVGEKSEISKPEAHGFALRALDALGHNPASPLSRGANQNLATGIMGLSGESFYHRPANPGSPLIERITRNVARSEFGKDLFAWHGSGATSQSHTGLGPYSGRGVLFVADRMWNRIVYGELEGQDSWLKSFGRDELVPERNFVNITGLSSENGTGESGTHVYVYVAESSAHGRISRLRFDWASRILSYDDSLTLDTDEISYLTDIDINTAGSRTNPYDDWVWVADRGRGQVLKFAAHGQQSGPLLSLGGPFPGAIPELTTPIAIACGRGYDGEHNLFVYVLDLVQNKLKLFRDNTTSLDLLKEHDLSQYAAAPTGGLMVDSYGTVYVGLRGDEDRGGRSGILKLGSFSLNLLDYFAPGPGGPAGIYRIADISNPLGSEAFFGFGDLFVTEAWDDESGGQWFYIGTELTAASLSPWPAPYDDWLQLDYTVTDGCWTGWVIERWNSGLGEWQFVQQSPTLTNVPAGQLRIDIELDDGGTGNLYRLLLYYESSYVDCLGAPINSGSIYLYVTPNVCNCASRNDYNGDGIRDVRDVFFMIDYVLGHGEYPPIIPNCEQNGDWNCDGRVDITDVTATIDYAFRRGPESCDPCNCSVYPQVCPNWPPL